MGELGADTRSLEGQGLGKDWRCYALCMGKQNLVKRREELLEQMCQPPLILSLNWLF